MNLAILIALLVLALAGIVFIVVYSVRLTRRSRALAREIAVLQERADSLHAAVTLQQGSKRD